MNDLDLRAALQRDAALVGSPSPDLLEQLVQRRRDQRRQRAGILTAGLAVAVIAAGVPIGASLMARSDSGPAAGTTAPITSTTSAGPSSTPAPPPPPAAEATPGSTVDSWMRQQFQGLSFDVPTNDAPGGVEVTPQIQDAETPDDWAWYDWNNGFSEGAPPVSILVSSAPGAHPESVPTNPAASISVPGFTNVDPTPVVVPGATSATYWRTPWPFEGGRPTMASVNVYLETSTRSYNVTILVPIDADGTRIAEDFVSSLGFP